MVAFLCAREGPFRLHLRELRICGPELAGILRIGIPAGIQGAVFSLSNTVVQATINGFGSAAIAGSAATLNFEYHTYFFVNAFGQTAVTFTGQKRREERRPLPGHLPLVRCSGSLVAYFGRDVHGVWAPGR